MRLQEGTYLAHGQRNPFLGLFPREHAHFGFGSQHGALHRDGERVRGDIVRQDQDRVLAITHEIARHRKEEVILVTNWSVVCKVISGRLAISVAPQLFQNVPGYLGSRISGRQPTGCASTAAATRLGARFKRLPIKGPPMQNPITMNLSIPR